MIHDMNGKISLPLSTSKDLMDILILLLSHVNQMELDFVFK